MLRPAPPVSDIQDEQPPPPPVYQYSFRLWNFFLQNYDDWVENRRTFRHQRTCMLAALRQRQRLEDNGAVVEIRISAVTSRTAQIITAHE